MQPLLFAEKMYTSWVNDLGKNVMPNHYVLRFGTGVDRLLSIPKVPQPTRLITSIDPKESLAVSTSEHQPRFVTTKNSISIP